MLGRLVAVAASVVVVVSTGLAWATLRDLSQGVTTSNALAGGSASKDGSVNILLMGLDSRADQNGNPLPAAILDELHAGDGNEGGYNTNTLIVMHIPNNGGPVAAFSIPRDDYVAVRDIPGNDHVKIKEAYGLKKAAAQDTLAKQGITDQRALETAGREAGRRETVQTVQDFLHIPIDHFAEVNLAGFYDMASALGGVEVCLNNPVNDSYSGANFPAGHQILNGAQSLAFVRQRHGLTNGDLDRTHRQQAFLASVTDKLSSTGTFTNLGKLQSLLDVAKKD
ncbi:MAG: LCP family protein, partial [Mycobacteriaceae bacterium]